MINAIAWFEDDTFRVRPHPFRGSWEDNCEVCGMSIYEPAHLEGTEGLDRASKPKHYDRIEPDGTVVYTRGM